YPLNITGIRLVNGIGLTDGIVELKVNDTWGQICQYPHNITEVRLVGGTGPYDGRVEVKINDGWGTVCGNSIGSYDADTLSYPLQIRGIRLLGPAGHNGSVTILVDDIWGYICIYGFTFAEANVICNMLGFPLGANQVYSGYTSNEPAFISNLQCNGHERHINQCFYHVDNDCFDIAQVVCAGHQPHVTGLRLAGTNGPYHGRVEVEVDDIWGTICSHEYLYNWDYLYNSANVICNMIGLRYYNYYPFARYGRGEGPIHIESLKCYSPNYTDINDCEHDANNNNNYYDYYYCSHADDFSVVCFGPSLNITDVRIINGTGPNDGRAEIKVDNTWGTICDSNFALRDAEVFCNMLGLKAMRFFTGALYGEGSGPVYIDQLFCYSDDVVLSDCQYLFLNECSHSRDVSIACN
ncbi:scavenger receptor cysteine-rich domain superfamily protein-like, partial [Ruditapes philippinarum]|uniref:scavenger receptor cysteine-rich domain superfamily protein-like n=1 Tax=Ruditapes philippinarum TaxID=129788 RepID=UPI00295C36F1